LFLFSEDNYSPPAILSSAIFRYVFPRRAMSRRRKAVEDYRSPRRFALSVNRHQRASVLDCASPLALLPRIFKKQPQNRCDFPLTIFPDALHSAHGQATVDFSFTEHREARRGIS
jgi:hypothetical protein